MNRRLEGPDQPDPYTVNVPLHAFDATDVAGRSAALDAGNRLLQQELDPIQLDDRFDTDHDTVALLDDDDGVPLGVAARSAIRRTDPGALPESVVQFALKKGEHRRLGTLINAVLPPEGAEIWLRPEEDALVTTLRTCWPSAFPLRRLHLMAIDLPVSVTPLVTRPLDPSSDADLASLVRINNAAFADHPEQAEQTTRSFRSKLGGAGHSAHGVRLAEIDGRINGFCWTQIHPRRHAGEISVIGLHPDVHGRGFGAGMTAAGLHWLHGQGLDRCFLYVESHNTAAIRSYRRLGFHVIGDDVSWIIPAEAADGY